MRRRTSARRRHIPRYLVVHLDVWWLGVQRPVVTGGPVLWRLVRCTLVARSISRLVRLCIRAVVAHGILNLRVYVALLEEDRIALRELYDIRICLHVAAYLVKRMLSA